MARDLRPDEKNEVVGWANAIGELAEIVEHDPADAHLAWAVGVAIEKCGQMLTAVGGRPFQSGGYGK